MTVLQDLGTGQSVGATFENWESEFLQMAMYVVLPRRSCSSAAPRSPSPSTKRLRRRRTRPVAATARTSRGRSGGGWALKAYESFLAGLFLAPVALHARGGSREYSAEQAAHGSSPVSFWQYFGIPRFWFESIQNWQSELMVVAPMVGASIHLRQRGSQESEPVAESHASTSA